MDRDKLNKISSKLYDLELECQKGINISENEIRMAELIENLSLEEIIQLEDIMKNLFEN